MSLPRRVAVALARRPDGGRAARGGGFVERAETGAWDDGPRRVRRRGGALVAWRSRRGRRAPRSASSAPTPTRRGCGSSPIPTSRAGWRSSASRSTAACCSTAGSTATSASPGGSSLADGDRPRSSTSTEPIARVPQLAIHLDRDVNERGLVLDTPAAPDAGVGRRALDAARSRRGWPSRSVSTPSRRVVGAVPLRRAARRRARRRPVAARQRPARQPGVVLGGDDGAAPPPGRRDHVGRDRPVRPRGGRLGSRPPAPPGRCSSTCSSGCWRRRRPTVDELHRTWPASSCVSADSAHAVHPNYPERHDPDHAPLVNHGPAIKVNANQRYATTRRDGGAVPARRATTPACRSRRSCRATTCRAARRSARSRPPASASPPSTSASPQLVDALGPRAVRRRTTPPSSNAPSSPTSPPDPTPPFPPRTAFSGVQVNEIVHLASTECVQADFDRWR